MSVVCFVVISLAAVEYFKSYGAFGEEHCTTLMCVHSCVFQVASILDHDDPNWYGIDDHPFNQHWTETRGKEDANLLSLASSI